MEVLSKKLPEEVQKVASISTEKGCKETALKGDNLESTKAEMEEVREENERLKTMLDKIEKDYRSLQLHFFGILKQQTSKKSTTDSGPCHDENVEPDLVSLCLGRSPKKSPRDKNTSNSITKEEQFEAILTLGLDTKFQSSIEIATANSSPDNSLEEAKEEEAAEAWPPSKAPKTVRNVEDEAVQQNQVKRARVSVRARCDSPTINDGCQWRKYGQKIAKGNPCPRAYYRCTIAPACPVRKQVQRCVDDMSILITTYEGTHNHPLPISATAMASTTSAAASMLLSGSSTSQPGLSSTAIANACITLNGSHIGPPSTKQYYLQNSPTSSMFQTITLDLTTPSSTSSFHFNGFSSTNLNFSSSESNNILPKIWGKGYNSFGTLPYYQTQNTGKRSHEATYQTQHMKNNLQAAATSQQSLTESLTKAITSDPSFRSVLAAATASMVGGNEQKPSEQIAGESLNCHNLIQNISSNLLV